MKKIKEMIPAEKGVYVLFLESRRETSIPVGRLGVMRIQAGFYAYIGSAYGGGGLRSRLGRHLQTAKGCRWHIDYIRRHMRAAAVWYTSEDISEHRIADRFKMLGGAVHMPGFGSSDCKCESHLFFFEKMPETFLSGAITID